MNIDRYIVLFFSTLVSLRMVLWLFKPSVHKGIAIGLYNKRRVTAKRIAYFLIFLLLSTFLVSRGSILNLMMAFFAIGALYDFLFTFFDYSDMKKIDFQDLDKLTSIPVKVPVLHRIRWLIGGPIILLTIWLWIYVCGLR